MSEANNTNTKAFEKMWKKRGDVEFMIFWKDFYHVFLIYRTKTPGNSGKYRFIIGIPDPKKMFHDPGGARNSAVESPVS